MGALDDGSKSTGSKVRLENMFNRSNCSDIIQDTVPLQCKRGVMRTMTR